jgi:hypothetical protein
VDKAKTLSAEEIDSLLQDVPPWFAPISKEKFIDIIRYLERQNQRILERKASREYKFIESVSGLLVTDPEEFLQPKSKPLYQMYDESLLRAVKMLYSKEDLWKPTSKTNEETSTEMEEEKQAEEERKQEEEEDISTEVSTEESVSNILGLIDNPPLTAAKKSGAPPRPPPERAMTTLEILTQYTADKNLILQFLGDYYDIRNLNDYATFLTSANQFGHVSPVIISATQLAISKLNSNYKQLRGSKLDHYIVDEIVMPMFSQEVAANIVTSTNAKENAGFFARNMKVWIAKSNETRRWENYWFFSGCIFDGNAVRFIGNEDRQSQQYQRTYGFSGLALPPSSL